MHLAILIWLYVKPADLPAPASRPIKVSPYSSLVFIQPSPPPPPPSPSLKKNMKTPVKPVEKIPEPVPAPIEAPKEVKPEPIPLPEPEQPQSGLSSDEPEGKPGGVPRGVPGGIPSETGNEASLGAGGSGQNGPVRPGGIIKPPKRTKYFAPVYPPLAIRARIEGTVVVEATIGKNGKIKDAKVVRSVFILDQAALEAIKKWEYEPPIINGTPVELILTVTINFVLK